MPMYFPAMLLFTGTQWLTPKPLPKISGPWPDRQICNVLDKDLPFVTSNPLYPDKDRVIFRLKNPLFSRQTYGGASRGLPSCHLASIRSLTPRSYVKIGARVDNKYIQISPFFCYCIRLATEMRSPNWRQFLFLNVFVFYALQNLFNIHQFFYRHILGFIAALPFLKVSVFLKCLYFTLCRIYLTLIIFFTHIF